MARVLHMEQAWRWTSQELLKITIDRNPQAMTLKLEGRVAGPWVAELSRVWTEIKPELKSQKLVIDLKDTTYADAAGIEVLGEIQSSGHAELQTNSPWNQYLAEEILKKAAKAEEER